VPRTPGVLCAFGLLVADVALDTAQSVLGPLDAQTVTQLSTLLAPMISEAWGNLQLEGVDDANMTFTATVDMRYSGQAYELVAPFVPGVDLAAAFHQAHERAYGYALPNRAIEVVNLRLQAVGAVEKPVLTAEPEGDADASSAQVGVKDAPGGSLTLYDRDKLAPGMRFDGGALVFQLDSTVYIAPGWSARVDGYRNLILEHS
jgi:N-methylhydantoinase A